LEITMQTIVTIGRKHVPIEEIALVEPFDAAANPQFRPKKDYKARVVLLNRDTVLAEFTPREFANAHTFRFLPEDDIAANPDITFRVESFEPTDTFKPAKPYATRLIWRDQHDIEHQALLLSKPETVIAVVLRGQAGPSPDQSHHRLAHEHAQRVAGSRLPKGRAGLSTNSCAWAPSSQQPFKNTARASRLFLGAAPPRALATCRQFPAPVNEIDRYAIETPPLFYPCFIVFAPHFALANVGGFAAGLSVGSGDAGVNTPATDGEIHSRGCRDRNDKPSLYAGRSRAKSIRERSILLMTALAHGRRQP
jgi:hypothetical protein